MLPRYRGACILYEAARTVDITKTSYSGEIRGNALSFELGRRTDLDIPGLDSVRFVSRAVFSSGSVDQNVEEATTGGGQYILAPSVDPRYSWVQVIGAGTADVYEESVRIAEHDAEFFFGLEGRSEAVQLGRGTTGRLLPAAGLLVQRTNTHIWTDIVRPSTGEYQTLDESLSTLLAGPQLGLGVELATKHDWQITASTRAAWLVGANELHANQAVYTTIVGLPTRGRPPEPHAECRLGEWYDTFLFGGSLAVKAPLAGGWHMGAEVSAQYWTMRPAINNPTYIGYNVTTTLGPTEGVGIVYEPACTTSVMLSLGYDF